MHHVLIVDPDAIHSKLIQFLLRDEGYEVTTISDPDMLLPLLQGQHFDLLLLEAIFPRTDGFELCKLIRSRSSIPVIFVSSRGDVTDRVAGLRAGADDYLVKPFDPSELLARAWAAVRRSQRLAKTDAILTTSDLALDPVENRVTLTRSSKTVELTPIEARLLRFLVTNAGRTMRRESIVIKVWGYDYERESNQLDVYVARLRSKIEDNPSRPELLQTIRRVGYKYQPSQVRCAPLLTKSANV